MIIYHQCKYELKMGITELALLFGIRKAIDWSDEIFDE